MRFFKTIKFRLTIWYLIVITVLLLGFGTTSYFLLARELQQNQDEALRTQLTDIAVSIKLQDGYIGFAERISELVWIYGTDGEILRNIGPNIELSNVDNLIKRAASGRSSFLTTTTTDGDEIRLFASPFTIGDIRITIVVGHFTGDITEILATFRSALGFSALAIIILAAIGGAFLANRTLRPVSRITEAAQNIGESDLSKRINVRNDDELGRLASTLNRMIERLESAFNRQRQFTSDASHELRTPLAIMQAELSLALEKDRSTSEYLKSLDLISEEVSYMTVIIEKLLFLARSDSGKEPLHLEKLNLRELLMGLSIDIDVLASEKGLQFSIKKMENLLVAGDRVKLRQLFLNIFGNAVRYTPAGGMISISCTRQNETAVVAINDTGIGISNEHLPHIFDRFYRVDKARSRAEGGSGLGLAIVKNIAESHGGKIDVESHVGKGSIFRVTLPLAA